MAIAKGMLKVKSGDTFVQFHPETSSDMVTGFREAVRENLPISVYSSNTAYAVNDCAFFEELPKWAYLRCTKGGTTGAVVPSAFTKSATLDQTINDGTVTWVVCKHGVPIDAKLKSIIANTITADSLLYGTGANTFGITALSALARTLIGKANAADMRSTLGAAAASHSHSVGDITNFASKVIEAIGDQTLSALGVRYSITTNGYICFGDLFGGLILQWWSRNYWDARCISDDIVSTKNNPNFTPFNITQHSGWEHIRVVINHIGGFTEMGNKGFLSAGYNVWGTEGITPYFVWIGDLKSLTVGQLSPEAIEQGTHAHLICLSY